MISAFGSRWTPGTSGWSIIPTCTPWFPAAALPRMASAGREDGWRHPRGRDKPYLVDNRVLSACVRDKFLSLRQRGLVPAFPVLVPGAA